MLLSFQIAFNFVRAAVACAVLERISGVEPSSETTAPRCLKLVTVHSFCPFTLISLWMPLALFVTSFVFSSLISILYLVQVLSRLSARASSSCSSSARAPSGSLNFSRSNLSLGWFGFLPFFGQTQNVIITRSWSLPMSALGKLFVQWMFLIRNASLPICNQSGCGAPHLGCPMTIFSLVEGQGCLSVLGC